MSSMGVYCTRVSRLVIISRKSLGYLLPQTTGPDSCFQNVDWASASHGVGVAGGSRTPARPQHRPAKHSAFMGVQPQGSLSGWRNMVY